MTVKEIRFWLLFILLNCILFLPAYLVNLDSSTFIPVNSFTQGPWYSIVKAIFRRSNYDIFRLSVDLAIWLAVFYIFRNKFKILKYSAIVTGYYLLLLIFFIYYEVMYKIFLVEPILFNDIYLLKLGYYNLGNRSLLIAAVIILVLAASYYTFYVLFSKLLMEVRDIIFGKLSKILIWIFCILLLINSIKSGLTFETHHVFQFGIAKMIDNLSHSIKTAKNISHLNVTELNNKSAGYKEYSMETTPDIYLLFIESYGKIVYQDSGFFKIYSECIEKCEKEITNNGWHIASNFSLSPVSGGSSWISYSSVMFGINFRNEGTYLYFLRNPETQKYTHIFKYLKYNGYKSYWINSMPDNANMEIPWKLYTDFYGVDQWVTYNDLNYHGRLYGWGPAPPDEYSLFKARQIIEQDNNLPHIVFYITHNSHNPFFCPDSVPENWQALNTGTNSLDPPSIFFKKPKASDYIKSINYEMQTLTRFIIQSQNKNAIYLLIGDHQPPVLSNQNNGFETPVHIIATDSIFVNNFLKYGFTKGFDIGSKARSIRHEAVYSMVLRELIRNYATETETIPEYQPEGFNTN